MGGSFSGAAKGKNRVAKASKKGSVGLAVDVWRKRKPSREIRRNNSLLQVKEMHEAE